jgi:hypothetical protein
VWAFGAIAELVGASCSPKISSCTTKSHLFHFVDNALDAGASKFHIDLLTTSQLFSIKPEPGAFDDPLSFYTIHPPPRTDGDWWHQDGAQALPGSLTRSF